MKVKVINATNEKFKVGQIFEIENKDEMSNFFMNKEGFIIDKDSCELIQEYPAYYNNDKGSLYQFAQDHNLNAWEFDIIKRIVRCRKKGNFKQDLEKTKLVIDIYLKEFEVC